jgi:ribosome biogenesis protein BMS1
VGDHRLASVSALADPCPLPSTLKKRGLNEKEKLLPMSDVGEMLYDKDAVYINIPEHQVQYSKKEEEGPGEGEGLGTEGKQALGCCQFLRRQISILFQGFPKWCSTLRGVV